MAEYRQLEDGSYQIRRASGWEPVSAEQVEAEGKGRLQVIGEGALTKAETIGRGLLDILPGPSDPDRLPMTPELRELNRARLDEQQEGRAANREALAAAEERAAGLAAADPLAAGVGSIAPELALGAAAGPLGGTSLRGIMAAEGALGAGLGAAQNPDAPLQGAAIGGALGAAGGALGGAAAAGLRRLGPGEEAVLDVLTQSRGQRLGARRAEGILRQDSIGAEADRLREAQAASGLERLRGVARGVEADPEAALARSEGLRSVGAAENPDPNLWQGSQRQLEGVADAREMLEQGFRMTETQARMLDATDGLELQGLRRLDSQEELAARTRRLPVQVLDRVTGAPKVLDRTELAHEQQAWVNRQVAEEMGITGQSALDTPQIERRMGELRAEFERINRETPGPIDMRGVGQEWERILDRNMMVEGNEAYRKVERIYADLASRVKKDARGNLTDGDVQKLAQMRTKLTQYIDKASETPRNQEVGVVLRELRDKLDERFRRNWTPEMAEDHAAAQRQWFVAKAAMKSRAAVGARGDINLPTFLGNYEGSGAGRSTGLLLGVNRDFFRRLKAAQAVMMKEVGDTGSGQTATEGVLSGLVDIGLSQVPGINLLR